jgi:hypothetical protein
MKEQFIIGWLTMQAVLILLLVINGRKQKNND